MREPRGVSIYFTKASCHRKSKNLSRRPPSLSAFRRTQPSTMGRELRSRAAAPSATTSDSTVTAAETSGAAKTATSDAPRAKLDKSGLYDLQQVKRLLDDEVIAVCAVSGGCILGDTYAGRA